MVFVFSCQFCTDREILVSSSVEIAKTGHSVAFYRCPNTLSPIWSTDVHIVTGAEMKKKWPPMHVTGASNVKKYYSSFASASMAATTVCHGVHKHSEAPVPTLWELESWSIGTLCQTEIFFGTTHTVDSLSLTNSIHRLYASQTPQKTSWLSLTNLFIFIY